jgi:hypothetical protein
MMTLGSITDASNHSITLPGCGVRSESAIRLGGEHCGGLGENVSLA